VAYTYCKLQHSLSITQLTYIVIMAKGWLQQKLFDYVFEY